MRVCVHKGDSPKNKKEKYKERVKQKSKILKKLRIICNKIKIQLLKIHFYTFSTKIKVTINLCRFSQYTTIIN